MSSATITDVGFCGYDKLTWKVFPLLKDQSLRALIPRLAIVSLSLGVLGPAWVGSSKIDVLNIAISLASVFVMGRFDSTGCI